ncbi:MAG: hypothetical protein QF732_04135, partial [Nitrospinaceae bacterium]|nr:hypothetical protein [Nitrospinaceae bacterium]
MKHIKFNCEYDYFEGRDALGGKWSKAIKASSAREAYEKFIRSVGVYQSAVSVTWGFMGSETFWDHVDKASNSNAEGKAEGEQIESQETKKLEDLEIQYQESGWASFLNFCGSLNLILFVIGGIWLLNASTSEQFIAMNLTI